MFRGFVKNIVIAEIYEKYIFQIADNYDKIN